MKELEEQRAAQRGNSIITPWVFADDRGYRLDPNKVYDSWKRYLKANNLPDISFHELRHTAISMYKGSIPKELLKEVVGHSASMDTFGTYGHQFDGQLEDTAAAMDAVLKKVIG